MSNALTKLSKSGGVVGTALHTSICYLAPVVGLPIIDILKVVGLGEKSSRPSRTRGALMHFLLGAIVFPKAFNGAARYILPRSPVVSIGTWSLILWFTGKTFIMPFLMPEHYFKRRKRSSGTYLLAHVVYGLGCYFLSSKPAHNESTDP